MPFLRCLLLVVAVATPSRSITAQWLPDLNARRLAWGSANIVIRSDTSSGVQVWAVTSRLLRDETPNRSFAARFDPDSVVPWLAYAKAVVEAPTRTAETGVRLSTPPLVALDQSSLTVIREQHQRRVDPKVHLRFTAPEGTAPWGLVATRAQALAFLALLFDAAGRSSYRADAVHPLEPNPADTVSSPQPLTHPVLRWPENRRTQSGEVWLTFVVRADSTVDQASIRVVLSDGAEYTAATVQAATSVRYRPAVTKTGPQDALTFQRATFRLMP